MVSGMVITMVDRDAVAMVPCRVVVSAIVADAAGGAADQLLLLLKTQW